MNKVEQGARAVCKEDGQDWNALSKSYNGRQRQNDYVRFSRSIIKSLVEPTLKMKARGAMMAHKGFNPTVPQIFNAMIKTALEEEDEDNG